LWTALAGLLLYSAGRRDASLLSLCAPPCPPPPPPPSFASHRAGRLGEEAGQSRLQRDATVLQELQCTFVAAALKRDIVPQFTAQRPPPPPTMFTETLSATRMIAKFTDSSQNHKGKWAYSRTSVVHTSFIYVLPRL